MNALLLPALRRVVADGVLASLLSGLPLLSSSRADHAHRVGHGAWRVGRPPLTARANSALMHTATSVLWGALYDRLRHMRRRPGRLDACTDALLLTAVAAGLDRVIAPKRLTPAVDRPRHTGSLLMTYGGFAAGLALGGLMALRHQRRQAGLAADHAHDHDLEATEPAPRRAGKRA